MEMSVFSSSSCNQLLVREEVLDRLHSLVRTMHNLQTGMDYTDVFNALKKNFTMEKAVKLVMLMERHCTEHQFGEQKKIEQKFVSVFQSVRCYGADIMQMYLNV